MATVGSVKIILTAITTPFTRGVSVARASLVRLGNVTRFVGRFMTGLTARIGLLVGAGGLLLLIRNGFKAADALAKIADQVGTTTEALAGFRLAAQLGGASTEDVEKGLAKMLKSINDANAGLTTAQRAFRTLGLDAQDLASLPTEEAFERLADGLANVENRSQRVGSAFDIFGRSGVRLINTLQGGSESLRAVREEARLLGLGISRVDTARVEAANDAFLKVQKVFRGISLQLATGLAPIVEALSKRFTDAATAGGGVGPKVVGAIKGVVQAIAIAVDLVGQLRLAFGTAAQFIRKVFFGVGSALITVFAKIARAIESMSRGVANLGDAVPGLGGAADRLRKAADKSADTATGLEALAEGFKGVVAEGAAELEKLAAQPPFSKGFLEAFEQIEGAARASAQAIADNRDELNAASAASKIATDAAFKIIENLQKQRDELGLTTAETERMRLVQGGASEGMLELADSLRTQIAAFEEQSQAQEDAMRLTESLLEPTEKYEQQISRLTGLLDRELISQLTFNRAVDEAREVLDGAAQARDAFARQGPEAFESRFLVEAGRRLDDPEARTEKNTEQLVKTSEQSLKQQERQTRALETLVRGGGVTVSDIGA